MFQIPKIPQKTKDLFAVVQAGTPIFENVFNSEYNHYTTISKVALGLATTLWASPDLSNKWNVELKLRLIQVLEEGKSPVSSDTGNLIKVDSATESSVEIPYGSGNYFEKVEDGKGEYAMPTGYDWSLSSLPNIWEKNMQNSGTTISTLSRNLNSIRYGTVMQQAVSSSKEVIDGCSTFQSDALATISEDLLNTSQSTDDLLIQFCLTGTPLATIIPDTPEEYAKFEVLGDIAESIIVDAQNFGSSVKGAYDIQVETQTKLYKLMDDFAQSAGVLSSLNDPCIKSLFGLVGGESFQEITGIKNTIKDSSLWSDFSSYFPTGL